MSKKIGEFQIWESKEEKVLGAIILKYTIFHEHILKRNILVSFLVSFEYLHNEQAIARIDRKILVSFNFYLISC